MSGVVTRSTGPLDNDLQGRLDNLEARLKAQENNCNNWDPLPLPWVSPSVLLETGGVAAPTATRTFGAAGEYATVTTADSWVTLWEAHAWFLPYSGLVVRTRFTGEGNPRMRVRIFSDPGEYDLVNHCMIPQVLATYQDPETGNYWKDPRVGGITWLIWKHGLKTYNQEFGVEAGTTIDDPQVEPEFAYGSVYQQTFRIMLEGNGFGGEASSTIYEPSAWWVTPNAAFLGWDAADAGEVTGDVGASGTPAGVPNASSWGAYAE